MDYETIRNNIEQKVYESKCPFPTFSRKANPNEYDQVRRAYDESDYEGQNQFRADCRKFAEESIGKEITDKQWSALFSEAWSEGHSSGYSEVLIYVDRFIDIVKPFVSSK